MAKDGAYLGRERNTDGIKAAAEHKRQEAISRTEAGIKQLVKEKRPVNFETVSEASGVTRAWLYKQPDLRDRIETLRAQQLPKKELPPALRASDKSKDTLIAELRKQNKELRAKLQEQSRELEIAYGQAFGTDDLQVRVRELEKRNQHLQNLLTQANAEIHGLKERSLPETQQTDM
jgi:Family of unknown function (DUF6262)